MFNEDICTYISVWILFLSDFVINQSCILQVFAEFPKLMSGLVAEEDKTLDAMKAQPEKSRDTISPSSGESDVVSHACTDK